MLQGAGLDQRYWAEAMCTAVYLKNRSPSKAVLGATPEEKWSGSKVNLNHLRIFGCAAYSVAEDRKKLDPKCKKYIFIGYCEDTKGYRLVDPAHPNKIITSRNVVFVEDKFYTDMFGLEDQQPAVNMTPFMIISNPESEDVGVQAAEPVEHETHDTDTSSSDESDSTSDVDYVPRSSSWDSEESRGRSEFEDAFEAALTIGMSCDTDTPSTVREALGGPESTQWKAAMEVEYQSFVDNKCLELVDLPKGKKPVKCKWIFKKKRGLNGVLLQYKARLVAKGFT